MKRIVKYMPAVVALCASLAMSGQDVVDKITEETCSCISQIQDNDSEQLKAKMGFCMISAAQPYEKQLRRKHDIDLKTLESNSETSAKLGQLIGMRMAGMCPDQLLRIQETAEGSEEKQKTALGNVTGIDKGDFLTIRIKNNQEEGRYLWLQPFDNSEEIEKNLDNLTGKNVRITYREVSLFDAETRSYRNFRVITNMLLN